MRVRWRLLIAFAVLAAVAVGVWLHFNWQWLAGQLENLRTSRAEDFATARAEIVRIEQAADPEAQLRDLMAKWGTGNQQFDLYLAEYVRHRDSSELLRQTFSLEFAWRSTLLPRWAQYWSWQGKNEPDERIASLVEYLDVLVVREPPQPITWREVLNLQAVFELTGQRELAVRLKPDNWRERYRQWQKVRPAELPHVARPQTPFPDWQGPPIERQALGETD
jgi:hypothetical protein